MKRLWYTIAGICVLIAGGLATAVAAPFALDGDEFPIIMFDARPSDAEAPDQAFPVVARMGVTFVHHYRYFEDFPGMTLGELLAHTEEIDKAWDGYGLRYFLGLHRQRIRDHQQDDLRRFVRTVKSKPGLGIWYLFDEPNLQECYGEDLAPVFAMLKQETPDVAVAATYAGWRHWQSDNYLDYLDILMPDAYPVKDQPFPEAPLTYFTERTERAISTGKPVIPIMQAFRWGDPPRRFPTDTELRFMMFASLTQGVRGIAFYSYRQAHRVDPNWMPTVFAPVLEDLVSFVDTVRPAHELTRLMAALGDGVYAALWQREEATFLVVLNGRGQERELEVSLEEHIDNARLSSWRGAGPDAEVKDGTLRISAKPWETFVWQVSK